MRRWVLRGLALAGGVLAFAVAGAFVASELMIHWPASRPSSPDAAALVSAAKDPGAAARGRRLAVVYGCHDCHGERLTGRLFFDQMPIAQIAGPNLSRLVPRQSDEALARAIRKGVAADGRALWIMPSDAFSRLTDNEVADLLAYLRSTPPSGAPQPGKRIGVVGRIGALSGQFRSAPALLRAEASVTAADLGPQFAQGRALARACMECHGPDLKGRKALGAPDLNVAGAYDPADFERLLRTGVAAGGRKLGLMSETAPGRFNALTHEEVGALHAYLKARAERAS